MTDPSSALLRLAPLLFVLIWSTGWIVARAAAPYADPLTFLFVRYVVAALVIGLIALAMQAPWPRRRGEVMHALASGVLMHGIYLGCIWWAVAQGLPAGISALIAAVQPILTALLAPLLLKERIGPRQWAGIGLGFVGILFVLAPKLVAVAPGQLSGVVVPILVNVIGMASVTLGTFYHKHMFATADLRTTTVLQYVGAALVTLPAALLLEDLRIVWNPTTLAVMAWSVGAISMGAIALFLLLIRHGAVSRAATLVYLVPPVTALQAYLVFGETLTMVQLAGMAITTVGVWLATRTR